MNPEDYYAELGCLPPRSVSHDRKGKPDERGNGAEVSGAPAQVPAAPSAPPTAHGDRSRVAVTNPGSPAPLAAPGSAAEETPDGAGGPVYGDGRWGR